jgi:hypothetical protein
MKTPDPFKTDPDRNFPEDYHQENGNYMNKCVYCENFFKGNKHRNSCKKCDNGSVEFFTAISKIKKPEDNKCAHAGCWSQGEMVGYAKCMLDKVFPATSQIEDLTKENARLTEVEECNKCTINNQRQEIGLLKEKEIRGDRMIVDLEHEKTVLQSSNDRYREALEGLQKSAGDILSYGNSLIARENLHKSIIKASSALHPLVKEGE